MPKYSCPVQYDTADNTVQLPCIMSAQYSKAAQYCIIQLLCKATLYSCTVQYIYSVQHSALQILCTVQYGTIQ